MAATNFTPSLNRVLAHEGGYSNHKDDNGGATMKGVIQRVYDAYRANKGLHKQSVRAITQAEIGDIYKRQYWDAVHGDELPLGVDYVVFDGGVNSGPKQSLKWLQKALGSLYKGRIDGVWGEGTKAALRLVEDHDALIARICTIRMAFLRALDDWRVFGKGWTSRVNGVLAAGQAQASGRAMPAISVADAVITPKAMIEDAVKRPTKAVGDAAIGGGATLAAAAQGIQEAIEKLTPVAMTSGTINDLVSWLTVGGVLLSVAGVGWRMWQKRREAERADALNLNEATA